MEYTGLGGYEVLIILLPLLAYAVGLAIFFVILYFVVRAAVTSGIRRAREHAVPTTPDA
ncbi:hypothetical protein [Brachybacterium sp. SGAir0954]|uniref:hypothetical protein n=1 Tax=Brachybacterium sp. SGAir0954 TaxID=2571029 RepID=UPI00143DBF74|nr:hypothetical protein [Brachybacterium sp. SGAir0954]